MDNKWMKMESMIGESPNVIDLKLAKDENKQVLDEIAVIEASVLGQVVLHISKMVVNNYVRVLGGDNNIISFNRKVKVNEVYSGKKLIVANDIWGGMFAISNGDFEGEVKNIWYFAPDLLQWEDLQINYAQFFAWVCSENIKQFYADFIWQDMNLAIEKIKDNEAVLVYPFLWSDECNIETANKKIVPIDELIEINAEYQKKLQGYN